MTRRRLLLYAVSLAAGVIAGTIADSGIVAGLTTLVVAGLWVSTDQRSDPPR